jgi:hypothetical protein
MTEVIEKKKKSLLEEHDYEEKVRVLNLNKRVEWFVDNKKQMSRNEKWDAFHDIVEDFEVDSKLLMQRINNLIRKKGLSVW